MVRRCQYGDCKSDCRYRDKEYMKGVTFHRFPNPHKQDIKWKKWITACGLDEIAANDLSLYSPTPKYVCSKHFVGGKGPTKITPNPLPLDGKVIKINGIRKIVVAVGKLQTSSDVPITLNAPDDISSVYADGFIVDLNSAVVSKLDNDQAKCSLASKQSPVPAGAIGYKSPKKKMEISINQNVAEPCKFANGKEVISKTISDIGSSTMVRSKRAANENNEPKTVSLPKYLLTSTENIEDMKDEACLDTAEPCEFANREDVPILESNANVGCIISEVRSLEPAMNNDVQGIQYSPKQPHILIGDCRSLSKVTWYEMPLSDNPVHSSTVASPTVIATPTVAFQELRTLIGCPINWTAFYGAKNAKFSYEIEDHLVLSYFVWPDMSTSLRIFSNIIAEHFVLDEIAERIDCIEDILKSLKTLENYTICHGNSKKQFCFKLHESIGNGFYRSVTDAFHHRQCELLIKETKKSQRCTSCSDYRKTLTSYISRKKKGIRKKLTLLSKKELIKRIRTDKRNHRYLTLKINTLQNKLKKKMNFEGHTCMTSKKDGVVFKEIIERNSEKTDEEFSEEHSQTSNSSS